MDTSTMKPREVESYLRESVRRLFGDDVENESQIHASHGYYDCELVLPNGQSVTFINFRKKDASRIVKALRALTEKK